MFVFYVFNNMETNDVFTVVEQAILEKNKNIEELQVLVETVKKEKTELQALLDEEKR